MPYIRATDPHTSAERTPHTAHRTLTQSSATCEDGTITADVQARVSYHHGIVGFDGKDVLHVTGSDRPEDTTGEDHPVLRRMSMTDAADLLGVDPRTVTRMVDRWLAGEYDNALRGGRPLDEFGNVIPGGHRWADADQVEARANQERLAAQRASGVVRRRKATPV